MSCSEQTRLVRFGDHFLVVVLLQEFVCFMPESREHFFLSSSKEQENKAEQRIPNSSWRAEKGSRPIKTFFMNQLKLLKAMVICV